MSFGNYKGLSHIFPKLTYDEELVTHFLIPLSIKFFNPKILGLLFSTKSSLT